MLGTVCNVLRNISVQKYDFRILLIYHCEYARRILSRIKMRDEAILTPISRFRMRLSILYRRVLSQMSSVDTYFILLENWPPHTFKSLFLLDFHEHED